MSTIKLESHKVLTRRKYWRVWLRNNTEAGIAARRRYAASQKGKEALAKAKAKYYQKTKEAKYDVCN